VNPDVLLGGTMIVTMARPLVEAYFATHPGQEQSSCVEYSVGCVVISGGSRRTAPQGALSRTVDDVVLIDQPFQVIPITGRPGGRVNPAARWAPMGAAAGAARSAPQSRHVLAGSFRDDVVVNLEERR
jgi:hypothetical protein